VDIPPGITILIGIAVSQYRIFPEGANPLSMGAVTLTIVPPEARSNNGDAWVVFKFDFVYTGRRLAPSILVQNAGLMDITPAPTGPTLVQSAYLYLTRESSRLLLIAVYFSICSSKYNCNLNICDRVIFQAKSERTESESRRR